MSYLLRMINIHMKQMSVCSIALYNNKNFGTLQVGRKGMSSFLGNYDMRGLGGHVRVSAIYPECKGQCYLFSFLLSYSEM